MIGHETSHSLFLPSHNVYLIYLDGPRSPFTYVDFSTQTEHKPTFQKQKMNASSNTLRFNQGAKLKQDHH